MYTIFDYIKWRGDISFKAVEVGEVDSLIFSELCYLDMFSIATSQGETLAQARAVYFEQERDRIYRKCDKVLAKKTSKLLNMAAESVRFKDVVVRYYEENTSIEETMQFSATTYEIDSDNIFIAFRGTDYSLTGWKEDFTMCTLDVIPSQMKALEYTEKIAALYPNANIVIAGHSKGGNLAVYSAVNSSESVKTRISAVYNYDGPGFKESLLKTEKYLEISDRITTIIPRSSFIGMLFEHEEDFVIVNSKSVSFWQHDAFNWAVTGGSFVRLDEATKSIRFADKTMKGLINGLDDKQKEQLVDAIFDVMCSGNKTTFADIRKAGIKNVPSMVKAFDKLDGEVKKNVIHGVSLLLSQAIQSGYDVNVSDEHKKQINSMREGIKTFFKHSGKGKPENDDRKM